MNILDIIRKKRLGDELSRAEIRYVVKESLPDYQLATLLMAVCIRGMTANETRDLTLEMADSGDMLDLSAIPGVKVDKHSTGGVGDTTTLILVPLVAACGAPVAKMSGRALGHTGGTLDKLEAIPGMRIDIPTADFINQVQRIGCAVVGQTAHLAPADKTWYALRDVTGTVDSLPLIVSSILSKKIAAGCDSIVLDVKSGSGAMMNTDEDAMRLAQAMSDIGRLAGRDMHALITGMDQPLGRFIGNALEVKEAILALRGDATGDLLDVSMRLGEVMLRAAGVDVSLLKKALDSGAGLQKLAEMIEAQGGDPRVTDDLGLLKAAPITLPIRLNRRGYITAMHTDAIGYICRDLGAGRVRKEDAVDPSVGIILDARLNDFVSENEVIGEIHAKTVSDAELAIQRIQSALIITDAQIDRVPLIRGAL